MGQIEQRLEADGTHRYLTAGVAAEETARQHLKSAIASGFSDAFLVAEIDGRQTSIAGAPDHGCIEQQLGFRPLNNELRETLNQSV